MSQADQTSHSQQSSNGEEPRVVVRDRRRIDPATGAVRTPDPTGPRHAAPEPDSAVAQDSQNSTAQQSSAVQAGAEDGSRLGELQAQLAERTSDLQRMTAEYANYRRRVERDREVVVATAKATVVAELLPVLDDIERAQAHGDLTGAFKSVADKLTATLDKVGLKPFGSEGDGFDPAVHQAVQHATSPDVDGPTVTAVLRRGYQLGERLLRTAMVAVTDHEPEPAGPDAELVAGWSEESAESTVDDQPLPAGPAADHRPARQDSS